MVVTNSDEYDLVPDATSLKVDDESSKTKTCGDLKDVSVETKMMLLGQTTEERKAFEAGYKAAQAEKEACEHKK